MLVVVKLEIHLSLPFASGNRPNHTLAEA